MGKEVERQQIPAVSSRNLHIKKRVLKNKALAISFDEKDLRNYVTGFQKRKKKRRKVALQQQGEALRRKRIEARKKRKLERDFVSSGGAPPVTDSVPDGCSELNEEEEEEEDSEPVPSVSVPVYHVDMLAGSDQGPKLFLDITFSENSFTKIETSTIRLKENVGSLSLRIISCIHVTKLWIWKQVESCRTTIYDNGDLQVSVTTSEITREDDDIVPRERRERPFVQPIAANQKLKVPVAPKKPMKRVVRHKPKTKSKSEKRGNKSKGSKRSKNGR
ncbi:hypothetical protein F8388_006860 [Cannabis sativa]|uniref:Nucleolar protein 12 n=1 Tax=Cannabis sativa TaxID=3483 RepID=A0A7J6GVG9_CANSA|nr:hypothetical protein F8388_006860 [Cannabis sativa]KAF4397951.1 hypothetical protein G4B88_019672 [Cannabis sativa]